MFLVCSPPFSSLSLSLDILSSPFVSLSLSLPPSSIPSHPYRLSPSQLPSFLFPLPIHLLSSNINPFSTSLFILFEFPPSIYAIVELNNSIDHTSLSDAKRGNCLAGTLRFTRPLDRPFYRPYLTIIHSAQPWIRPSIRCRPFVSCLSRLYPLPLHRETIPFSPVSTDLYRSLHPGDFGSIGPVSLTSLDHHAGR